MMKWIFGILAIIILFIAFSLASLMWMAMAYDLQKNLEDNLTLLKRDTILEDRELSFSYQDGGVEMMWLQPAYTLIQPIIIYTKGDKEYRFSADRLTFQGSFFGNEAVKVRAPEIIQMTYREFTKTPKILKLKFDEVPALELLSPEGENHVWDQYRTSGSQSGVLKINRNGKMISRLNYTFSKIPPRQLKAPYSPHLEKVIQYIEATVP